MRFKKYISLFLLIFLLGLIACEEDDDNPVQSNDPIQPPPASQLYFPSLSGDAWDTLSPADLSWDATALDSLYTYLEDKNTRAFIILKDGKMVVEKYFGDNILGTTPFGVNTIWYWASAGKALTATLVGIAQEEGFLNINDPSATYLDSGWTSLSNDKEQLITVKDQLRMTTGLDYVVPNLDCTLPSCLTYRADAGQQWFYHNAPYTLLEKVVENASGIDYNQYTNQRIEDKVGMSGLWIPSGYNNVYWSTARDMARFGLLTLNRGKWEKTEVLSDQTYFDEMVNTSQSLNPSYGYLWWLNGKSSIIFPVLPTSFPIPLADNAPDDLFAGLGKNGQFVEVIPSQNLVVVRMGEAPDSSLVPIAFHNEMWEKINGVIF